MSIFDQIPGYRQAVAKEMSSRNQSFLALPESVGGFDVKPLTLRHVLTLTETGNVFMCGGVPAPVDIAAFFIVVSEKSGLDRWLLLQQLKRKPVVELVESIKNYLEESFQDSPAQGGGESISYYSSAAALVDVFASEYGWREQDIIDAPLKRLFQYLKAITKRNNPRAVLFNPSDRVRGEWLRLVNGVN